MARSERPHTPARDDNNDGDDDVWSVLLWAGGLHARRWLKASGPTPQRKGTVDDSNDGDDDWSVLLWAGGLHARRWLEASDPTPQRKVTTSTPMGSQAFRKQMGTQAIRRDTAQNGHTGRSMRHDWCTWSAPQRTGMGPKHAANPCTRRP